VSFIRGAQGLSVTYVGEYFSRMLRDEFIGEVFKAYCGTFDFAGMSIPDALRHFLVDFRLPGEAQVIDRIMESFADQYVAGNPNVFSNGDTVFVLAFSIIMLNTDLHSPSIKPERKMTVEGFIKNNRGIDNGNDLPTWLLSQIYQSIKNNEIKMSADSQKYGEVRTFLAPEFEGWLFKQDNRTWSSWQKRWFVVTDSCLYYFVKPEDKQMRCMIPLEDGVMVNVLDESSLTLLIGRSDKTLLKSAKLHSDGSMKIENRKDYVLKAQSNEELHKWVEALRSQIVFVASPGQQSAKRRKDMIRTISSRMEGDGAVP